MIKYLGHHHVDSGGIFRWMEQHWQQGQHQQRRFRSKERRGQGISLLTEDWFDFCRISQNEFNQQVSTEPVMVHPFYTRKSEPNLYSGNHLILGSEKLSKTVGAIQSGLTSNQNSARSQVFHRVRFGGNHRNKGMREK